MISLYEPKEICNLKTLPARVLSAKTGDGSGTIIELQSGEDKIPALIALRSAIS